MVVCLLAWCVSPHDVGFAVTLVARRCGAVEMGGRVFTLPVSKFEEAFVSPISMLTARKNSRLYTQGLCMLRPLPGRPSHTIDRFVRLT